MNKVIIKSIDITDFRGQTMHVDLSDKKTAISGRNKSGKSTIFNAFLWLFTGADDHDRKNFELFDCRVEQTYENSKRAIVQAEIEMNDISYTFKKTASVGWVRRTGSEEYERKGSDNYNFFIDDVERSATEYKQTIEEMFAPIERLKLILNIRQFINIDWKARRKIMEEISDEVTEEDMKGEYGTIITDLKKLKSPEKLKESYKKKLLKVKEQTTRLPSEIDGMFESLPNENEIAEAEVKAEEIRKQIEEIDIEIQGGKRAFEILEGKKTMILSQINDIEKKRFAVVEAVNRSILEEKATLLKRKNEITESNLSKERVYRNYDNRKMELSTSRELLLSTIDKVEKNLQSLRDENKRIKAMEFKDDMCVYCGQPLPPQMVEANKAKFNESKAKMRESLIAQGLQEKDRLERLKGQLSEIQAEIEAPKPTLELESTDEIDKRIAVLDECAKNVVNDQEYIALGKQIEELRNSIPAKNNDNMMSLFTKRKNLELELASVSEVVSQKVARYNIINKIEEKKAELKTACAEKAELEGLVAAVDKYIAEKASIVSQKVNRNFKHIHVEMEETDKSGNTVPCCNITVEGVNDSVTNNASLIIAGIDLSNALCRHYGINMPLFVDNAECINDFNMPETDRQTITLSVSNKEMEVCY